MKYIGAHVSASGGVENAPENAFKIGATALPYLQKIKGNGNLHRFPEKASIYFMNDAKNIIIQQHKYYRMTVI